MAPLLRLQTVSKAYGSLVVTNRMDLDLMPGEALGVIGPNGAGKSTMFNLITGDVRPDSGKVFFGETDVTAMPPYQRCRLGIGRSYQIPHPFVGMTVFENLLVGACFGTGRRESQVTDDCAEILERTGLLPKANLPAGKLSLLERKRLELARALATGPKALLLDEIAGGLTEAECQDLVATIRAIHAGGTAIIWIEHVVHALLSVIQRLVVINFGAKLDEGDPQTVFNSPQVQEIYMGISAE
ncbi:MAG: ABC transporter ATP-binding protein [Sneathiellaceae bacterium]